MDLICRLCGFNLQLVQLVGRFWVFFLNHTAPGFQLWFYFHLCLWAIHWGLLLRLPWRTWVCPSEGQAWRWCSCLGRRGSGSSRPSGELAARTAGNTVLRQWHPTPVLYLENPMSRGAWWAAVHGVVKSRTRLSDFTFTFHFSLSCIGEGNGSPLQCPCLENPRDSRDWWAAVYGVAQSWIRLKRLSSSSSSSRRV